MDVTGYSSEVILALTVCGVELMLSHVGSNFLIIRETKQAFTAENNAELKVSVDGTIRKKHVFIPNEIPEGRWVRVSYY